jgi:hypothetical protein
VQYTVMACGGGGAGHRSRSPRHGHDDKNDDD